MKSSFFFCTFSFLNISYRHSFRSLQPLERKTHSKMKSEVAAEIRMEDSVMFLAAVVGWIDGFHAHIKAKDEVAKVEA